MNKNTYTDRTLIELRILLENLKPLYKEGKLDEKGQKEYLMIGKEIGRREQVLIDLDTEQGKLF